MRRRDFIAGLGGAATWSLTARAQPALPVIGYLSLGSPAQGLDSVAAFRKGLSEMGYAEGRNVAFEFRWAQNDFGQLPKLAAGLVRRRVGHDCGRRHGRTACCQSFDRHDSNRLHGCGRPHPIRYRHEPQPAGRQNASERATS